MSAGHLPIGKGLLSEGPELSVHGFGDEAVSPRVSRGGIRKGGTFALRCTSCWRSTGKRTPVTGIILRLMASDQELGTKEIETSVVTPFLDAYEWVTGERLFLTLPSTESPDFVCVRARGSVVGLELTKLTTDKNIA